MNQTFHSADQFNNHRYRLERRWLGNGKIVNFVMLNPSTADDIFDDPTIRKCIGYAKSWGYSELTVTNLFAFRATDPKELKKVDSLRAVGGDANNLQIALEAVRADIVCCAWGAHPFTQREAEVIDILLDAKVQLFCIGKTKYGAPLHPSRPAYTALPVIFVERL